MRADQLGTSLSIDAGPDLPEGYALGEDAFDGLIAGPPDRSIVAAAVDAALTRSREHAKGPFQLAWEGMTEAVRNGDVFGLESPYKPCPERWGGIDATLTLDPYEAVVVLHTRLIQDVLSGEQRRWA